MLGWKKQKQHIQGKFINGNSGNKRKRKLTHFLGYCQEDVYFVLLNVGDCVFMNLQGLINSVNFSLQSSTKINGVFIYLIIS